MSVLRLEQIIAYTPLIREPAPYPARLQAYKDGTPLLGPKEDSEGWKTFPPIEIDGDTGKLFQAKERSARIQ